MHDIFSELFKLNILHQSDPMHGKTYNSKGIPQKTESYLLKSLKIRLEKEPDKSYDIATTKCELAKSYFLQKKYNKALALLTVNYKILLKSIGDKNIETINTAKLLKEVEAITNRTKVLPN